MLFSKLHKLQKYLFRIGEFVLQPLIKYFCSFYLRHHGHYLDARSEISNFLIKNICIGLCLMLTDKNFYENNV